MLLSLKLVPCASHSGNKVWICPHWGSSIETGERFFANDKWLAIYVIAAANDLKLEFSGIWFTPQFSFPILSFFLEFFQSFGVRDASASHEHTAIGMGIG